MRELWAQAFKEFEKLADLSPDAADARISEIAATHPRVAALIRKMRIAPAINLPPIPWHTIAAADDTAIAQGGVTIPLLTGQRLGAYQLVREIGRGGMGSVWLSERADGMYHGQVAIKLLNGAVLNNVGARQRFAREGEILSKLAHPNIARLLDAGTTDVGARYLVLEYVDGVSLRVYCDKHRLGIRATIELFCQALEAVAYAHSLLILHRDIKPGNVLVNRDGQVKLLDFGLGKLLNVDAPLENDDMTRVGGPGYTPRYSPPEQMGGGVMGTPSDVYSLGVTLYEILTGTQLDLSQRYTRPSERLAADGSRSNLSREVRGDLDSIIAKAVSERPHDRYANAGAMLDDLHRYLNHEPVTAQPDTTLYRAGKFVRRHTLAVGSAALATILTLVSLAIALWQWHSASVERAEARYQASAARTMLDVLDAVNEDVPNKAGGSTTREQIDRGLAIVKATPNLEPTVRATLLASFASRYSDVDDIAQGIRIRDEALAILTPLAGTDTRARDLRDAFTCQQQWDRAVGGDKAIIDDLRKLAEAVAARRTADPETVITCLHAAASVSRSASDLKGAQGYVEMALARIERATPDEISAMHRIGIQSMQASNLANAGDVARAAVLYQDILRTFEARGMQHGTKWFYFREMAAWTAMMGGDIRVAAEWVRDDYPRLVAIKGAADLATRTETLAGRYWLWVGDNARATTHLDAALESAIKKKAAFNTQRTLTTQALAAIYGMDTALAEAALARLRARPPLPASATNHRALLALAEAAFALRHRTDAKGALELLQPHLADEQSLRLVQLGPLLIAAEASLRLGETAKALDYCRRARDNAEQTAVAVERSIWVAAALFCEADALDASQPQAGPTTQAIPSGKAQAAKLRDRAQAIWRGALPSTQTALNDPKRLVPRVP